jgi:hypothetical protein
MSSRRLVSPAVFSLAATLLASPLSTVAAQDAAPTTVSGKWSATLVFTGRMAGELRVERGKKDTESQARIELRNAPINRQIAWDIAEGVCGDNAQPITARARFRQMLISNDGSGNLRVTVPRLQPGKRYYVRVFDAGEQGDDRSGLSCVNLSEEP